jgi:hypothetical protein
MHLRDSSTAAVMRRASVGPHALMMRRALQPFVPDRGMSGLGAGAVAQEAVTGIRTGMVASSVATGVASAIGAGAAAGSVVPVIGTAIGAIVGLIASGVFNHRRDPEDYNFQQAMAMSRANGPQSVLNIDNKYLVLAGLFDLEPGQIKGNIPIYKKYGRLGEYRFVTDLCNLIYSAAQGGQITASDTPQSVFNRIVQPWINGFGFGSMSDSNAEMITMILLGMTAEYIMGQQTRWYARGGDFPFGGLPPFSLPQAIAPTASATPSPVPTVAAPQAPQPSELQRYQNGALPQVGSPINYAQGSSGDFLGIPAGGTFAGVSSQGWIIQYATGQYVLNGRQLVPYPTAQVTTVAQPAPATQLGPSAGTPQLDQKITLTPAPASVYSTGSGYYPAPVQSPQYSAPALQTAQQPAMSEMLLFGGGALLLVLLLKRRSSP